MLLINITSQQTSEDKWRERRKDQKGSLILVYKNKKYGISCEREFEINELDMVVGFSSKGCF